MSVNITHTTTHTNIVMDQHQQTNTVITQPSSNSGLIEHTKNVFAGTGAGIATAYAAQPLYNYKLDLQKGVKGSWHPRILWGGVTASVVGDALGLAAQNSIFEGVKKALTQNKARDLTSTENMALAVFSGGSSAIPLTASELVMDYHRQNVAAWKKINTGAGQLATKVPGYRDTIKKIIVQQGIRGLFRGVKCTGGRETCNVVALKSGTDFFADQCKEYVSHPLLAKALGGVLAGGFSVYVSHPFDTAKVKIQNGITTGYMHANCMSALKKGYQVERRTNSRCVAAAKVAKAVVQESYKGAMPRTGVVAICIATASVSIPCVNAAFDWLYKPR